MANHALITRRLALLGAAASSVALAVPAAAMAHVAEHPNDKVRRLGKEMAEALRDPVFIGSRRVTVTPDGVAYDDAEEDLTPGDRFERHFAGVTLAMDDLVGEDSNGWRLSAGKDFDAGKAWRKASAMFAVNEPVATSAGEVRWIKVDRSAAIEA